MSTLDLPAGSMIASPYPWSRATRDIFAKDASLA